MPPNTFERIEELLRAAISNVPLCDLDRITNGIDLIYHQYKSLTFDRALLYDRQGLVSFYTLHDLVVYES